MRTEQIEVIKCLCGATIAGCVDGEQDGDWNDNKEIYIRKGYTVEYVSVNQSFQFGKCKCKEIINKVKEHHPEWMKEKILNQNK